MWNRLLVFRKLSNLLNDNLNLSVITGSKSVIPTHSLMCTLPFPPDCLRSHIFFSKNRLRKGGRLGFGVIISS